MDDSGIPIAIIKYEIENLTDNIIDVSVSGNIRNFIGKDEVLTFLNWKGIISLLVPRKIKSLPF